jgi:hypothetical protein
MTRAIILSMNLRQYLSIMAIGTAAALSAWCIVVMAIDPVSAGGLAFLVFYVTLLSGLSGLLTILGTIVRARKETENGLALAVARSFRQSLFLSLLVVLSLYLMGLGLFSTPILFLLIGLFGLIEFFFLFRGDKRSGNEG